MNELLKRLAEVWSKDSRFEARLFDDGIWFFGLGGTARINPDWKPERFDIDAAPARTIIEDELMKNEGHVAHLFSGDLFTTTWWRGDRSVAGDPCYTRTEALVTVAIAVFESIANKKSPPG